MISFHSVDIDFIKPFNNDQISNVLFNIAKEHKINISDIKYIFTSDSYLLKINKQFLNHDYYTDVITFNHSGIFGLIGEVYISVEYVQANYLRYSLSFRRELNRCIIHGLLHLIGYDDGNFKDKSVMRNKENHYLGLF